MTDIAYINGEFTAKENAAVSIEDRGFQFGDSIYEVIKLYDGKLFKLKDHLQRLLASAEQIKLDFGCDLTDLQDIIERLMEKNEGNDKLTSGSLYIQITRGAAPRSHSFSPKLSPTVIMYFLPPNSSLSSDRRQKGVQVITLPDKRWDYCSIKTTNLLPNILGRQQAKEAGAYEGLFVNDDEIVTEGTSSNVFIVQDGVIKTHPLTDDILGGITRQVVLKLARSKFPVREEKFTAQDLHQADEVFLTSTTKEVLGVVKVDDQEIKEGQVGEITWELYTMYREYIEQFKQR